ncbi:hypothetical protein [Pseudoneobacillus sp. C159]
MSEEQKKMFYTIIKDAYEQGKQSDQVTIASLLEEITQKLEVLLIKD